jgi:hypothetical protein
VVHALEQVTFHGGTRKMLIGKTINKIRLGDIAEFSKADVYQPLST